MATKVCYHERANNIAQWVYMEILEAEQRIAAIARDLVNHYIDNILPNGFKAQVVCHSKLAAIRYRSAIEAALTERLERERLLKTVAELIISEIKQGMQNGIARDAIIEGAKDKVETFLNTIGYSG